MKEEKKITKKKFKMSADGEKKKLENSDTVESIRVQKAMFPVL